MSYPAPEPVFVTADANIYSFDCRDCVHEKNAGINGRAWGRDETSSSDDVRATGSIPLDVDALWAKCPYGHKQLVLRDGSERARNFSRP